MLIDYHDEDYGRQGTHLNGLRNPMTNNQLNGNIGGVRWHNSTNPVSMQTDAYTYSYNKNNWLQTAKYGKATHNSTAVTFTQDTHKDYEVSNVSYDANGNLLHLKRNGVTDSAGNNHMDAFTYHYESNTNQLSSVEDLNDNSDPNRFNDLKNQYQSGQDNYIYNDIGQLVSNLQDNIYYEYNASGLVNRITTIGASNSGDLATLYFEDYTNATAEDVMGWTDNNTGASGAGAFSGFSINHGTYKVGDEKCVYLSETYENSLNVVLPNGVTAMRSFDVHADVQHILDLDIIVSQSAVLFAGEVPPQYHIGYHIRVKDANGTVLATETINNPPQIIHNDLPGGDPMLLTTCDYFYDNHHHLSFTPTSTTVQLEIEMITPDAPTALLNIDNVHLQASAVPKLAFYYNDRGHRVKKQAYTGAGGYTTTYYIRDVAGNPMAIYEAYQPDGRGMYQPPTPKEYPVYGNSRLGVYFKDTSSKSGGHYVYQLADHLGNVRAVVMKSGNNSLSLTNKTDYYPFGMPMPNRNVEGNYRYGYQGEFAEKEPELGNGQSSFELRLYDARIGRWLTPDPMSEFINPYLAMGNNPIYFIDPTGGITECPDPPCWQGGVQELDEVVVTAYSPGSSGWSNFLNNVVEYARETGNHIIVMSYGGINAWTTDQVLGYGRASSDKFDGTGYGMSFRLGQIMGDVTAIFTGDIEIAVGSGGVVGGVLATPATGGLSLAGSAAGVGIATHGGTVVVTGTWNLAAGITDMMDQMSSNNHNSGNGAGSDKGIPRKLLKDNNTVDLDKFTQKVRGTRSYKDPKTGWTIDKDTAGHGGRAWKLKDKQGNRIASLAEDGKILAD